MESVHFKQKILENELNQISIEIENIRLNKFKTIIGSAAFIVSEVVTYLTALFSLISLLVIQFSISNVKLLEILDLDQKRDFYANFDKIFFLYNLSKIAILIFIVFVVMAGIFLTMVRKQNFKLLKLNNLIKKIQKKIKGLIIQINEEPFLGDTKY